MAADKKTLLRDALKQVQAGKVDKAIETYKAVVRADPRDATVHNTLGDLYVKQSRKREAVAEYLEASTLYEKDGFALRSIAVCQKVANIEPDQLAVRIRLGDLYASQRLPAEARTQYLQVADVLDKKGDIKGALEIFRKIANLDPDNLPVRVKLAGMFEKQKFADKAAEEYVRAAKGYFEKKEVDSAVQLYVRAFKLSPGNLEARRRLADYYAQRQDWPVVIGLLETPVAKGSRDVELLVVYAEALTRVNHPRDAVKVLEPAQEREPNSVPVNLALGRAWLKAGDLEKGTAALNRCVSAYIAENRLELAEPLLGEMAAAAPDDDKTLQRLLEVAQKRADKGAIAKAYLQLAGVYEKKGLVRSATGALEKYLEVNPADGSAAKRLHELKGEAPPPKIEAPPAPAPAPPSAASPAPRKGQAPPAPEEVVEIDLEGEDLTAVMASAEEEELVLEVEDDGQGESAPAEPPVLEPTCVTDALALVRQGASARASAFLEEHLGRDPGDQEAWTALVSARRHLADRLGVRDALLRLADLHRKGARFEEAQAAYRAALDADPRSAAAARGLTELLLEEEAASAPTPPLAAAPSPPSPVTVPADEKRISLELTEQTIEASPGEPEPAPQAGPVAATAPEPEPAPELEPELERVPEPEGEIARAPEPEREPEPAPRREPEPVPDEFVLDIEPAAAGSPDLGALGEASPFAGLLEPPAAPTPTAPQSATSVEPKLPEPDLGGFGEDELRFVEADIEAPPAPAPPAPVSSAGQEFDEFLAEADFYCQQGLFDEAEFLYKKLLQLSPGHPGILGRIEKLEESRPPAVAAAGVGGTERFDGHLDEIAFDGEPATAPAEAFPDENSPDFSGFLDGLRQELAAQEPPAPLQEEQGLTEIFQEFQRSVKEQLGDEDFETHYNLGIAYKEMGLIDEALAEFTLAEKSPERRLNAVSMIALCLREAGRFDEAALKLRTGISLALEGSEAQKGFLYDLAALHEQAGRTADAKESLLRLLAIDAGYRDVASRVAGAPAPANAPSRKKPKVSYL